MASIGITPLSWPDPVTLAVDYLRDRFAALDPEEYPNAVGVTVSNRVPDPRPTPCVRVQREGGTMTQLHDVGRLMVESWHDRDDRAADLCGITRDLLRIMPGVVDDWTIHRVEEVTGPTALSDPISDSPRYFTVVEITVRAKRRTT
jgi:hypothetical protein